MHKEAIPCSWALHACTLAKKWGKAQKPYYQVSFADLEYYDSVGFELAGGSVKMGIVYFICVSNPTIYCQKPLRR